MENRFIFKYSPPDYNLLPQISRVLEARTNRLSRMQFPKLWNLTDWINNKKKASGKELKSRRKLKIFFGVLIWFLGMFLLLPGIMAKDELMFALIVGSIGLFIGVLMLWQYQKVVLAVLSLLAGLILSAGTAINPEELGCFRLIGFISVAVGLFAMLRCRNKNQGDAFDKAAKELVDQMRKMTTTEVAFSQKGIEIPELDLIPYEDIEAVFETEDLIAPIYQKQILILKKKDLTNDIEIFHEFLAEHTELIQG